MTGPITNFPQVLDAARQGDEHAWTELYDSVAAQMLGYLKGRGAVDPEGLLGEAFLQLSRNLRGFEGDQAGFRSWAFTVAHHRLIDERRKLSKYPQVDENSDDELGLLPSSADVEAAAIEAVDPQPIQSLLATLSEDQQNVILLRVLGGLTAAETAAAIGKNEGTVRVLQHRALQSLRHQLTVGDAAESDDVTH